MLTYNPVSTCYQYSVCVSTQTEIAGLRKNYYRDIPTNI